MPIFFCSRFPGELVWDVRGRGATVTDGKHVEAEDGVDENGEQIDSGLQHEVAPWSTMDRYTDVS